MVYIHLFQNTGEFEAAYNGSEYRTPWVSYTIENGHTDYNKRPYLPTLWSLLGNTTPYPDKILILYNNSTYRSSSEDSVINIARSLRYHGFSFNTVSQQVSVGGSAFTTVYDYEYPQTNVRFLDAMDLTESDTIPEQGMGDVAIFFLYNTAVNFSQMNAVFAGVAAIDGTLMPQTWGSAFCVKIGSDYYATRFDDYV